MAESLNVVHSRGLQVAEVANREEFFLFGLLSKEWVKHSKQKSWFTNWYTYEESVHELDFNLLTIPMQPDRVDHSRAVMVKISGTRKTEQHAHKQADAMPPAKERRNNLHDE